MSNKGYAGSLAWTDDQLKKAFDDPKTCFSGESCHGCKSTANVITYAGWFCECGEFNVMLWYGHDQRPHETPTYGPSGPQLQRAANEVRNKAWWERMGMRQP